MTEGLVLDGVTAGYGETIVLEGVSRRLRDIGADAHDVRRLGRSLFEHSKREVSNLLVGIGRGVQ